MGVWAIWDLPTAVANMFCKSIFSIQTCGPLMSWWNHLSSSLMGSSAMGTHIASAWRKFGAIGSSKRTGWVWPSFGAEKNIRLLLKLCWTWDLLPTLQEWLNLNFFPMQTHMSWVQSWQRDLHATNLTGWKVFDWWILGSLHQTRKYLFPGLNFILFSSGSMKPLSVYISASKVIRTN